MMRNVMRNMAALLLAAFCQTACHAENKQGASAEGKQESKALVVYFSATGTTREVATQLAKEAKADLMEITPQKPYTQVDLDWRDKQSRSTLEMHDDKARPAVKKTRKSLAAYKVIYLGYPIWWDLAPRAVNTFVETYDLTGKTVIPFATSGGSSIDNSVKVLKATYPKLNWQNGALLNSPKQADLRAIIKR